MSKTSSEIDEQTEGNGSTAGCLLNAFVAVALTLLGSFVVLEIGLRQLPRLIPLQVCASDPIIANYYCQNNYVYDKPIEIAYRYKPNLRIEGMWDPADPYLSDVGPETRPSERSDAFHYVLQTDEMGFPNDEPTWRDQYDIIITGDSFTVRSAPQTWIELLREQSGRSILTLGAPSWTTLNEAAAVEKWGLDKNPDWVILMYFEGNDLINIQQYQEKQASGLDWREYDLQGVPWWQRLVLPRMIAYWMPDSDDESTADPPVYRYPIMVNTEEGVLPTVLKDIHLLPISAEYDVIRESAEFAAVGDALLSLKQQVEAQGARFLVVYIPSKEHVVWSRVWDPVDINNILARTVTVTLDEEGRLSWQPQYVSYDYFNAHHADQMHTIEDFTAENEIEFLNLTPLMVSKTIELGEVYHYADPHWNQVGNQLAADAIQAYIEGE